MVAGLTVTFFHLMSYGSLKNNLLSQLSSKNPESVRMALDSIFVVLSNPDFDFRDNSVDLISKIANKLTELHNQRKDPQIMRSSEWALYLIENGINELLESKEDKRIDMALAIIQASPSFRTDKIESSLIDTFYRPRNPSAGYRWTQELINLLSEMDKVPADVMNELKMAITFRDKKVPNIHQYLNEGELEELESRSELLHALNPIWFENTVTPQMVETLKLFDLNRPEVQVELVHALSFKFSFETQIAAFNILKNLKSLSEKAQKALQFRLIHSPADSEYNAKLAYNQPIRKYVLDPKTARSELPSLTHILAQQFKVKLTSLRCEMVFGG